MRAPCRIQRQGSRRPPLARASRLFRSRRAARTSRRSAARACGSFVLLVALYAAGCHTPSSAARPALADAAAQQPPRTCTRWLRPSAGLQQAVQAAQAGAMLCLSSGRYLGPVRIQRSLTLWGPRDAVVVSNGSGTTIEVRADRVELSGFTIDGSGSRYDTEDAALAIRKSNDVRASGLRVQHAVFGILAEQSNRVSITDNTVIGNAATSLGLRGDGVRVWEVRESEIIGNHVLHSRDVVVWYSPGNRIADNLVEHSRYGTHLMYSHDNHIEHNVYRSNVVGLFSMYSRNLTIAHNQLLDAAGAGGMGLGAKEAEGLRVLGNLFVHDQTGAYLDTTPLDPAHGDVFEGNLFALDGAAVVFHGRTQGNDFRHNGFISNHRQLVVEGGGDALAAHFEHNHYDDYAGYDLDGDGTGDLAYRVRSLSGALIDNHPVLSYFTGTPALFGLEVIGKLVPLFAPKTIMVDPMPRMAAPRPEQWHAY